ncbi:sugar ABC transporter substrate-binding protein [Luteococcus sp. OSA5]|uniref:sugar ABC transporter substrate-binding protein n=1 Tax=Luteococcus sp. OSA5 TaxID=3401630 RepID=UPI003B438E9D
MTSTNRRKAFLAAVLTLPLALSACGGGSGFDSGSKPSEGSAALPTPTKNEVSVLIGSSGDAETKAVTDAVKAWSAKSGIPAKVQVAADLPQQAAQGFASGKPADVVYTATDVFASWVKAGNLEPYGDQLENKDDYYPGLQEAFTKDDKLYCAPKDFSTLQLVINDELWKEAGLTDADHPKTWEELETVAKKLTKGKVKGLALGPEVQRLGVFLAQAGGGLEKDGEATANSAENVEALTFVKKAMTDGWMAYSSDLGSGWGGEAFGKQQAAMVIEGNWITGAMQNDFKDVKYTVVELPQGKEKGTLQYTNCWGVTAKGDNIGGAVDLVEYLTTTEQQLAFAKAFGVMPSLQSAKEQWSKDNPTMVPFINGADYAQNLPAEVGAADVIKDMNAQLSQLKSKDPKVLLDGVQANLEPVVADAGK